MLKRLSLETQETLLALYNAIWSSGHVPLILKEAINVPGREYIIHFKL